MLAAIALSIHCASAISVDPWIDTPLRDACTRNFSVKLITAETAQKAPDCLRLDNTAACVLPRGFPLLPALGLALTGDNTVVDIAWGVLHPDSAFFAQDGWVTPADVELLNRAGLKCNTTQPPRTPETPANANAGKTAIVLEISGGIAALVVVAGLSVQCVHNRRKRLEGALDNAALVSQQEPDVLSEKLYTPGF